jgi:3-hydroxyisobutyrate dehydrogenase-like beta-hydroxyacid dehydrogenase
MSTVDVETITDVSEAIITRGGRFLEAPVVGSKQLAKDGQLVVLAAGDKSLYDDCHSCFQAMGRHMFYLGEMGYAGKMKLVLNLLFGTMLAGLAESMALAEKIGLNTAEVLNILTHTSGSSAFLRSKGTEMALSRISEPSCKLQTLQKDLRLAINMSDSVDQPLHVGAAVNELFKKAKAKGYGEYDIAAVYRAADL